MSINNPNQPQENVIADYNEEVERLRMEGNELAVRKAKRALLLAAGLIFISEMVTMYRGGLGFDPIVFIIALIEAGIFIGLVFLTKTKPFTAVLSGLIVFCAIILFSVIVYGMEYGGEGVLKALFGGIIFKVIILTYLIMPLKDAKELQDWLNKQQAS